MPLHVITGVANAGKTGVVHERVRATVSSGASAALLLPAQPDVSRAMRELSSSCPLGLQASTLEGYVDSLWRSFGDGRRIVTPVQRAVILAESGSSVAAGAVAESAASPGFRRMLEGLVQRAAESIIRPVADDGPTGRLLAYIAAYMAALGEAGLIERAEAHRLLAERVDAMPLPSLIAADRFTGLTGTQERLLVAMAVRTDVTIALTYDPMVPATEAARSLVERLGCIGTVELVSPSTAYSPSPELVRIERELGTGSPSDLESGGAVTLSAAQGSSAEAARIVAEVQGEIGRGVAPGSIAVVFREPGSHLRAVAAAFAEAGIPVEWDARVAFEHTGLGRALLALLDVASGTAHSSLWMDLMRSPYSPAAAETLDRLDATMRREGIRDTAASSRLTARLVGPDAAFIRSVKTACADLTSGRGRRKWHPIVAAMLGRAHGAGGPLTWEASLDCAASRVFAEALEGLSELTGPVTPALLAGALRGSPVSTLGLERPDRVQIMGAERARGRRFTCVIMGGLTTGEFPRRTLDEAYTAPGIAHGLEAAGIDLSSRAGVEQERLLFYQVATRATERLVLSWQSHDGEGRPLAPSVFIEEVLDLYRGVRDGDRAAGPPRRVLGLDSFCLEPGAPQTERREIRADRRASAGDGEGCPPGPGFARAAVAIGSAARAALASRTTFSVTDIELYLQCPYRWFIERVIRPRELDESMDAASAGRLAHAILAATYDEYLANSGADRVTEVGLGEARAVHARVAARIVGCTPTRSTADAALARKVVGWTARVIESDTRFLPALAPRHREWSFGLDDGDQPEDLGGFGLVGRIDRIDSDGTRLVITDYKTGSVGPERGATALRDQPFVQIPLYGLVAARRLGLEFAGGVYRPVKGGKPRGIIRADLADSSFVSTDVVDADGIAAATECAMERARAAVDGIRAGEIPASPVDGACPAYCAALPLCPVGRCAHA